jgi:hypothetical protein
MHNDTQNLSRETLLQKGRKPNNLSLDKNGKITVKRKSMNQERYSEFLKQERVTMTIII